MAVPNRDFQSQAGARFPCDANGRIFTASLHEHRPMRHARFLTAAAVLFALAAATPASAQLFGGRRQDEAIAALQQQTAAITQRLDGSPGQPGLAPQLATARGELERAQARIADLEESLRTVNSSVETLSTELAQSRSQREAVAEQNRELAERLARLESRQAALQQALDRAAAAPPPEPVREPAEEEEEEEPQRPAPRPSNAEEAWTDARLLIRNNDFAAAETALEVFVAAYPRDPRLGEANHHLAEARFRLEDWTGAAAAYAASLRGWPRTPWAAESALKLAQTLGRLDRDAEGCQAVAEFGRRYAPTASERGRQRAATLGRELGCQA